MWFFVERGIKHSAHYPCFYCFIDDFENVLSLLSLMNTSALNVQLQILNANKEPIRSKFRKSQLAYFHTTLWWLEKSYEGVNEQTNKITYFMPTTKTMTYQRLWLRYFSMDLAKFRRTPFLKEHLRWLFLFIPPRNIRKPLVFWYFQVE